LPAQASLAAIALASSVPNGAAVDRLDLFAARRGWRFVDQPLESVSMPIEKYPALRPIEVIVVIFAITRRA
jgi:hypothetical protein